MKRITAACLIVLLLNLWCACGVQKPADKSDFDVDNSVSFEDDLGRNISMQKPKRVAALIGSFADVWCLAGGRESLVAAANDTWTSFDLALDESVADLGAIKEPNLEVLLAAEPDLVLASCNTQANLDLMGTFEQAGITAAYFDVQNFNDYLNMLQICCGLTGKPENYTLYGNQVKKQVEAALSRQDDSNPSVLCIRSTGSSCKIKGSTDNLLGEMLADLGCRNVADSQNSLLDELSLEAVIASDPDYIFAVLQGSDPADAREVLAKTLLTNPAWEQLRAVQNGHFFTLDHELYNLKPNARWGEAYEKLADILYQKQA